MADGVPSTGPFLGGDCVCGHDMCEQCNPPPSPWRCNHCRDGNCTRCIGFPCQCKCEPSIPSTITKLAQQADPEMRQLVSEYHTALRTASDSESEKTLDRAYRDLLAHIAETRRDVKDWFSDTLYEVENNPGMTLPLLVHRMNAMAEALGVTPIAVPENRVATLQARAEAAEQKVQRLTASVTELEELVEKADAEEMYQTALEILSRVFDDGPEKALPEFLEWYKPSEWLHWSRALGAFIYNRLEKERDAQLAEVLAVAVKQATNERVIVLAERETQRLNAALNEAEAKVQRLTSGPYAPLQCRAHWHVGLDGNEISEGTFATEIEARRRCDEVNARWKLSGEEAENEVQRLTAALAQERERCAQERERCAQEADESAAMWLAYRIRDLPPPGGTA